MKAKNKFNNYHPVRFSNFFLLKRKYTEKMTPSNIITYNIFLEPYFENRKQAHSYDVLL